MYHEQENVSVVLSAEIVFVSAAQLSLMQTGIFYFEFTSLYPLGLLFFVGIQERQVYFMSSRKVKGLTAAGSTSLRALPYPVRAFERNWGIEACQGAQQISPSQVSPGR